MTEGITWMDLYLHKLLDGNRFIPYDVKTVLDLGCGKGMLGTIIRNFRDTEYICGIDAYEPYMKFANRVYDRTIVWDLNKGLPKDIGQFDLVISTEFIEHLERRAAANLLDESEKVGKCIIMGLPHYVKEQSDLDGNPWQVHRQGLSITDFRERGYRVWGLGHITLGRRIFLPIQCDWLEKFPRFHEVIVATKGARYQG